MLQTRFGLADVATLSYATPPDGLRLCALNPSPPGIVGGECGRLLSLPCGLDRLMLGLQPHGELARRLLRPSARRADRAGATGRAMEADTHDRITRNTPPWRPSDAGLALGTARLGHRSDRYIWRYVKPDAQSLTDAIDDLD